MIPEVFALKPEAQKEYLLALFVLQVYNIITTWKKVYNIYLDFPKNQKNKDQFRFSDMLHDLLTLAF